MNKAILILLFLVSYIGAIGQSYSAFTIPTALSKDADAVIRLKEGTYEALDIDKARFTFRSVVTILNANAKDEARLILYYDDARKIKNLKAKVYNQLGVEVASFKEKDFEDYSAIDDISLYDDNRVKFLDARSRNYPYTVEFEYELEFNTLYSVPDWFVIDSYDVSVEKSEFTLNYKNEFPIRYKTVNTNIKPIVTNLGDRQQVKWQFNKLQGFSFEPYSKGIRVLAPIVKTAPTKFDYDGYEGETLSWDGYAKWQVKLNTDLEGVPEEIANEVKELVKGLNTEKEKISAVYKYMQDNTRYVSIQLGIGGFRPFSPAYVAKNGYGDCKALTYYTKALLSEVGIDSRYSWIHAGGKSIDVDPEFPDDMFNHIILFVPTANDTTWLECTNQNVPAGYLGSFTANRKALVISDDGKGELITTPDYKGENNKVYMNASLKLNEGNYANAAIQFKMQGVGTELNNLNFYIKEGRKEQESWIKDFINLADYALVDFSMQAQKDSIPKIDVDMSLEMRSFSTSVSDRILFSPAALVPLGSRDRSDEERKSDIYLNYSTSFDFNTEIEIPTDYTVHTLPEDKVITTEFGSYVISYEKSEKGLLFKRQLSYNNGTFSKDKYKDFVAFLKEIKDLEKRRVMLIKAS